MESFTGSTLVQQEPDASSFPSGGLRDTFEARGYTAWDPSSPAFIMELSSGITLCIPTIFVSYTGEMLDNKGPLLKSLDILDDEATHICQYFDRDVSSCKATLGPEQEYFLVDRALFNARPDLVMTGRTVLGHFPARGQQLGDHYFGSIPTRVQNFLVEFETECLKLGIPLRTRHNEVAPGQFECATTFGELNVRNDQNRLLIDVLDRVAEKHGLKALTHEKPFEGVNGNGKHCNWSLRDNFDKNVLQPSSKAKENMRFLTFFVNIIKAVHDNADLIRASIASAGNDHRLGANEAPPAIMSVYIGSEMTNVLRELENNANLKVSKGDNMYIKLGITKIPKVIKDNTDRNRTSPFAFTGNKFEFRGVGGDFNCATPMTVLNTAIANQLKKFREEIDPLIEAGEKKDLVIINTLRRYVVESKNILFEGNGYSEDWLKEAKKRKLSNELKTPYALDFLVSRSAQKVFEATKVLSKRELIARHEILLDNYTMKIQIEARVMGDLIDNHVIPTALKYQNKLIENARGLKEIGLDNKEVVEIIAQISDYVGKLRSGVKDMIEERRRINKIEDQKQKAVEYCDNIKGKYFNDLRYASDKLELLIDNEDWPLIKYRELLFMK